MKAKLHLVIFLALGIGHSDLAAEIDVLQYMPLNLGDIYTYDDSSQAVITRMTTLNKSGVSAYEKVWTRNAHPVYGLQDSKKYYSVSGDSLFWAGLYYRNPNDPADWEFHQISPPALMGTSSTADDEAFVQDINFVNVHQGNTETFAGASFVVDSIGEYTVPAGVYEDCIKISLLAEEGDTAEYHILARGVGKIAGTEIDVGSEDAPVHALVSRHVGEPFDIFEYFPLDEGLLWTYSDSAKAAITGARPLTDTGETAVERTWVLNPNPGEEHGGVIELYLVRDDSLYLAGVLNGLMQSDEMISAVQYRPLLLLGTSSMVSGFSYQWPEAGDIDEAGGIAPSRGGTMQVTAAGTFEVLGRSYENVLRLQRIEYAGADTLNYYTFLAKGIGPIMALDPHTYAPEYHPNYHALTEFGQAPVVDIFDYFPLTPGMTWIYDRGDTVRITGTGTLQGTELECTVRENIIIGTESEQGGVVTEYLYTSGDSLFIAGKHFSGFGDDDEGFSLDPPVLLGTSNMHSFFSHSQTFTFTDYASGENDEDSFQVQVIAPGGIVLDQDHYYNDCLRLVVLNTWDYEVEGNFSYLAKDVGEVAGNRFDLDDYFYRMVSVEGGETVTPGEINGDGKIDIFDLLALLKVLSGKEEQTPPCDVDTNDKVDIFDLLALLGLLKGS